MISNILLAILFSLLINWIVSLQIVNQVSTDKNYKIISVSLALIAGFLSGLIILL